jgi:organic radical activating enzyme
MEQRLFFDIGILPVGKVCDLRCKGCFWSSKHPAQFMKASDPLFTHLSQIGIKRCFIGGGEPFLHPKIDEILSNLAKKVFIRYLLTHGGNLSEHKDLINGKVDTLIVSLDKMHKEAMREKDYPMRILSSISKLSSPTVVRINTVIKDRGNLPFLFSLRDKIASIKQIKNWHIYPMIPRTMSMEEYCKIIDSVNASSPLNFKVEYKIPQSNFLQLLIFPDYSIESLSFDDNWSLKQKMVRDIFTFNTLDNLLQHAKSLHKIDGSSYEQMGE